MSALPELPSDLLRLALRDLRMVESMPETYVVDMGHWHREHMGKCHVCLGGAVLAGTLGLGADAEGLTALEADEVRNKLLALDCLRCGEVGSAVAHMLPDRPMGTCPPDRSVPEYGDGPEDFHAAMEDLAAQLEDEGL